LLYFCCILKFPYLRNLKNLVLMKKAFLSVLFLMGVVLVGVCDDPPPFNPGDPTPVPVDGGVSLLLAAGAAYGIKKVRDNRKAKAEGETSEEN
jgi:hypothetical protein